MTTTASPPAAGITDPVAARLQARMERAAQSTAQPIVNGQAPAAPADSLPGLLPHHVTELRASGLNDETIRAASVYSEIDHHKIAALLCWRTWDKKNTPALVFPYCGTDGTNGYFRCKLDRPRLSREKPVKYESPKGRPNEIYLPPGVADALDSDGELILTSTFALLGS